MYHDRIQVQFGEGKASNIMYIKGIDLNNHNAEHEYTGPIGSFTNMVLDIPNDTLDMVASAIAPFSQKLYNEPPEMNYIISIDDFRILLENLKNKIADSFIYFVLIELPFSLAIVNAELYQINFNFNSDDFNYLPSETDTRIRSIASKSKLDTNYDNLIIWRNYIYDVDTIQHVKMSVSKRRRMSFNARNGAIQHAFSILNTIEALKKLKLFLPRALKYRETHKNFNSSYDEWLNESLRLSLGNGEIIFFTGIIAIEQNELIKRGLYIKKCKLCGSLFTSSRVDASYCHTPNPNYQKKPCNIVGPRMLLFDKKHYKKYNSTRAALYKWCNENRTFANENADEETYKKLDKELMQLQQNWQKRADEARELLNRKEITEEEFYNQITLPLSKDRSKTLTQLRESLR